MQREGSMFPQDRLHSFCLHPAKTPVVSKSLQDLCNEQQTVLLSTGHPSRSLGRRKGEESKGSLGLKRKSQKEDQRKWTAEPSHSSGNSGFLFFSYITSPIPVVPLLK